MTTGHTRPPLKRLVACPRAWPAAALVTCMSLAACGGSDTGLTSGIVQGDERLQPRFDEVLGGTTYSFGPVGSVEAIWGVIDGEAVALSRIASATSGAALTDNLTFEGSYIVVGGRYRDGAVDGMISGSGPIAFAADLSTNDLTMIRASPFQIDARIDGGTFAGTMIYDTALGEIPGRVEGVIGQARLIGAMAGEAGDTAFAGGFAASAPK